MFEIKTLSLMHLFTHSIKKHLFGSHFVPRTVLGTEEVQGGAIVEEQLLF